jgi:hypothetical protein
MQTQAQKRLLIALKSPVQELVDTRARCEDCGNVLVDRDFLSYWDGQGDLLNYATPRSCVDCGEEHALRERGVTR